MTEIKKPLLRTGDLVGAAGTGYLLYRYGAPGADIIVPKGTRIFVNILGGRVGARQPDTVGTNYIAERPMNLSRTTWSPPPAGLRQTAIKRLDVHVTLGRGNPIIEIFGEGQLAGGWVKKVFTTIRAGESWAPRLVALGMAICVADLCVALFSSDHRGLSDRIFS